MLPHDTLSLHPRHYTVSSYSEQGGDWVRMAPVGGTPFLDRFGLLGVWSIADDF